MTRYLTACTLVFATYAAIVGCTSSKVGAGCYLPYGISGTCAITTTEQGLAQVTETTEKP